MADSQVDCHTGSNPPMTYAVSDTDNTSSIESAATKIKNLFARRHPKIAKDCPSQAATFHDGPPIDSGYSSFNSGKSSKLKYVNMPIPQQKQHRFRDIRCLFDKSLLDAVPGDISMKLKWVGDDESCIQLCIIIQCVDKRAVRKAEKFFNQSHVREEIEKDFEIRVIPGLCRLNGDNLKVYGKLGSLSHGSINGTKIRIQGEEGSKLATIGGLISVKVKGTTTIYALTAGHLIPQEEACIDANSGNSVEIDLDESDGHSETSDIPDEVDIAYSGATDTVSISEEIGFIERHSFEDCYGPGSNYDWALLRLSEKPNGFAGLPEKAGETSALESSQLHTLPFRVAEVDWALHPNGIPVYAMTARGRCYGGLVYSASCIRIAPGTGTVETLDFIPAPNSNQVSEEETPGRGRDALSQTILEPGDSGCWVVRESSGEIFGHIVSSDAYGEAYVLPLGQVFRDIQFKLNADEVLIHSTQAWPDATEPTEKDCIPLPGYKLFDEDLPLPRLRGSLGSTSVPSSGSGSQGTTTETLSTNLTDLDEPPATTGRATSTIGNLSSLDKSSGFWHKWKKTLKHRKRS